MLDKVRPEAKIFRHTSPEHDFRQKWLSAAVASLCIDNVVSRIAVIVNGVKDAASLTCLTKSVLKHKVFKSADVQWPQEQFIAEQMRCQRSFVRRTPL